MRTQIFLSSSYPPVFKFISFLCYRRPLLTPLTPGCMSDYMERFNEMQNRIRLTLASNNT